MGAQKVGQIPTAAELAIWRNYVETAEAVRSAIADRLEKHSGLSASDYPVLLALSEAEGATLRPSDLAAAIGWERSRLSHQLGRMERRGLVSRVSFEQDSRGLVVHLTADGLKAFRASTRPHLADIEALFISAFSPEQLEGVKTMTEALRRHLDEVANPP